MDLLKRCQAFNTVSCFEYPDVTNVELFILKFSSNSDQKLILMSPMTKQKLKPSYWIIKLKCLFQTN